MNHQQANNNPWPSACPVCRSLMLREKPFGYSFNGKWLGGFECGSCGVIFIHPQPTSDEIGEMYSREYFEGDFRCGHAGSYFDEKTLTSLEDERLISHIKQFKPGGKFLEIGCAGGAFLHAVQRAGYETTGVEFSDVAAKLARDKFDLDVITGDITHAQFPDGKFDVIFMGDVLEHLPDPITTCKEVFRILAPSGIFVIECPTQTNTLFSRLGFFVYGLIKKTAVVHLPPYHLFEYRPASMEKLLCQCGFDIVQKSEGMIPPGRVMLRGSGLQRLGKKIFQYPNYVITKTIGRLGDRIELIATVTKS
jgi:SAM-dependent methyltransferase